MGKREAELPHSFVSFYLSLVRWVFTEAYDVIDSLITFIAVVLFFVALFSKELANQWETRWQGMSRWYSLVPLAVLLSYRTMKANYAHFESVVSKVDGLTADLQAERDRFQQPDVSLSWNWPINERQHQRFLGGTEKQILVHNRSKEYVYNVQLHPIELGQGLTFDVINEIAPDAQLPAVGRWDDSSSLSKNYVYFFARTEEEGTGKGWYQPKPHNRGLSYSWFKIPMVLTYQSHGITWEARFEFVYDVGEESCFTRTSERRV